MKKKTLILILIFISIFFINTGKVNAAKKCEASKCTPEEANSSNTDSSLKLVCSYKVTIDNGKTYYNFIYYDIDEKIFKADSTLGGKANSTKELYENSTKSPFILGAAAARLKNACPKASYIDTKGDSDEICFDDGEPDACKNNGKKYDGGTNFNKTTSSSKLLDNMSEVQNYGTYTYSGVCKNENDTLASQYDGVCRYEDSSNDDYVILYYDKNSDNTLLVWYMSSFSTKYDAKATLKYGEEYKYTYDLSFDDSQTIKFQNKIHNINSCPATLNLLTSAGFGYLNQILYATKDEANASKEGVSRSVSQPYSFKQCINETPEKPKDPNKVNCSGISPVVTKYAKSAMTIICIAVPILLIGLITADIISAIFAGSEDKVKKSREKIIKRIIIAAIIFFVPTLINLTIRLVNEVWPNTICEYKVGE